MTKLDDDLREDGRGGVADDGHAAGGLRGRRGAVAAASEEPLRDDHDTDVPRARLQRDRHAEPDGERRPERSRNPCNYQIGFSISIQAIDQISSPINHTSV